MPKSRVLEAIVKEVSLRDASSGCYGDGYGDANYGD